LIVGYQGSFLTNFDCCNYKQSYQNASTVHLRLMGERNQ